MKRRLPLILSFAFAALAVAVSPSFGVVDLNLADAWRIRLGLRESTGSAQESIFQLRLARTTLAFVAGGALAVAGVLLQTLLRNSLATPFTLGVATASSFGAFLVIAFPGLAVLGGASPSAFAFACALLSLALVLRIGRWSRRVDGLLLAGVTLNFLFGAGVMLVRYLADPLRLTAMERWMLGSVEAIHLGEALQPALLSLIGFLPLWLHARDLDQLAFDEELAASRGVPVRRVQTLCLLGAGLMTAAVIARTGPIGFIGLMVPHALRPFTGLQHRVLLPAACFAGGGFLVLADALARSLQIGGRSSELPVGIVTALLGGPFFLMLLLRRTEH